MMINSDAAPNKRKSCLFEARHPFLSTFGPILVLLLVCAAFFYGGSKKGTVYTDARTKEVVLAVDANLRPVERSNLSGYSVQTIDPSWPWRNKSIEQRFEHIYHKSPPVSGNARTNSH